MDNKVVSRSALIAGAGLAVLGIILFVLMWVVLGRLEVAQFPRLILSVCVPPALMALLLGGYILIVRPGDTPKNE